MTGIKTPDAFVALDICLLAASLSVQDRSYGRSVVSTQLTRMGHELDVRKEYSDAMGRGQAVLHSSITEVHFGASDPRAHGAAVSESTAAFNTNSQH